MRQVASQRRAEGLAGLKHDTDRDALAERIPILQQSLFWFTNTLRVMEPSVNECDGCGEPATIRVRDTEQEEFFLCSAVECAEWADPAEQHDISAADWEPFVFPRPPIKAPRLQAPTDGFEANDDSNFEDWDEYDEEHEDEEWYDGEDWEDEDAEHADDDAEEV